jgi:hypothetical protein
MLIEQNRWNEYLAELTRQAEGYEVSIEILSGELGRPGHGRGGHPRHAAGRGDHGRQRLRRPHQGGERPRAWEPPKSSATARISDPVDPAGAGVAAGTVTL